MSRNVSHSSEESGLISGISHLRAWTADRQRWQRHLYLLRRGQLAGLPAEERRRQAIAWLSRPGASRLSYRIGALGEPELAAADAARAQAAYPAPLLPR